MAILRQRLSRKNEDQTFSAIHLETSSDIVMRPDGTSVEDALGTTSEKLTEIQTALDTPSTHASTHSSGGSDPVTPLMIGAADRNHTHTEYAAATHQHEYAGAATAGGAANAAVKLQNPRSLKVNLGSVTAAEFDGSADANFGVTGILPIANGGTGVSTLVALAQALYGTNSPLGRTNFVTDALCSALGLATSAAPSQVMDKLRQMIAAIQSTMGNSIKVETGSYAGTGSEISLVFGFKAKVVFVVGEYFYYESGYKYSPSFGCIIGDKSFACGVYSARDPYMLSYGEVGTITDTGALIKRGYVNANADKTMTYYYIAIG